jgi:hypothetical protein
VQSANFDVIDGMVDFSKAIDDDETQLDVAKPWVWSLRDLKRELPAKVEQ